MVEEAFLIDFLSHPFRCITSSEIWVQRIVGFVVVRRGKESLFGKGSHKSTVFALDSFQKSIHVEGLELSYLQIWYLTNLF